MRFNTFSILALIALIFIPLTSIHAAEVEAQESALSDKAQKAVEAYEADLAEAAEDYGKEVLKARDKVTKALDSEVKALTRKGDLEAALGVNAKIETINDAVVTDLFGNVIPARGSVEARLRSGLIGKAIQRVGVPGVYTFSKDGTVTFSSPGRKDSKAMWAFAGDRNSMYIIWPSAWWDKISVEKDSFVMTNCEGKKWKCEPAKADKK